MWRKESKRNRGDTSWQQVSNWYGELVGDRGHYYHQHVVIPQTLRLLDLDSKSSLIDLACGDGVLARNLKTGIEYVGIDLSPDLIRTAQGKDKNRSHKYLVADVTRPLEIERKFSHAAMLLALQNIKDPEGVFENISGCLQNNGRFVMVINHPCFRIPRQSGWGVDEKNKSQYRKITRYLSQLEIPILANPGQGESSKKSWSFHYPLSAISQMMQNKELVIEAIEEWTSDKKSGGRMAKAENRSRNEIPLFMALLIRKLS